MNKFYFVQSSYTAPKACAMELEIRRDATNRYLHHIIREDDIPAIVEELQELQADYCSANRRVRQVEIKAHENPMVDGLRYIYIGNSFLSLIEVKGSEKEAAASDATCGTSAAVVLYSFSPSAVGSILSPVEGSLLDGYGFVSFRRFKSMPSHMTASCSFVMARLRSRLGGRFFTSWIFSSNSLRSRLFSMISCNLSIILNIENK